MKLNFGCAWDLKPKKESWINADKEDLDRILELREKHKGRDYGEFVYKRFDFDVFPYPFKDNAFNNVVVFHTLEHLDNIVKVMEELWRICKDKTVIEMTLPYFSGTLANTDPTYKHRFSYRTFEHFEQGTDYFDMLNKSNFKIVERKILFSEALSFLNFIPNLFPKVYERFFAYIFPSQSLYIKLKVVK